VGNLDWKWIGIGVVVMLALSLVGGLLIGMLFGPGLEAATSPEDLANIQLSGGQIALISAALLLRRRTSCQMPPPTSATRRRL
jgi:hypothetical protein